MTGTWTCQVRHESLEMRSSPGDVADGYRVYTKKRGDQPDLSDPICLRQGATIETVCHGIHRSLASHFK